MFRKAAITNVQIKSNSGHNPKILDGIFTGFIDRAYKTCSKDFLNDEINFLINVFVENGYQKDKLNQLLLRYQNPKPSNESKEEGEKLVTLPWIPGLSPKLRKVYKKAGYKTVFKSNRNLKTILTSKNKTKLPPNSHPGVYQLTCSCNKTYIGETGCKISTRIQQHQKSIEDGKWDKSGISEHAKVCHGSIDWNNANTLCIESRNFKRKVREALEIQRNETGPIYQHGMNQDDGNYVTTTFWKPLMKHFKNTSRNK